MRRVERPFHVPRRIVAVRPHDESVLPYHRLDALHADRDVLCAIRRGARANGAQKTVRRDQRENARRCLFQAAVRIVRKPFQCGDELPDRRAGHRDRVAGERALRVEGALIALYEAYDPSRLAPRRGRTDGQLQIVNVRLGNWDNEEELLTAELI